MARRANNEANASEEDVKIQDTVALEENENTGAEPVVSPENEDKKETIETTENKSVEESTKTEVKITYISVRKKTWVDLQDNNYEYKQGDPYPRQGLEVSEERIKELSGINNKLGEVLIQKVENKEE